jgi:5-methylthioribose kinase
LTSLSACLALDAGLLPDEIPGMFEIDLQNAPQYLRNKGWVAPEDQLRVTRLSGGVSNEVFYVSIVDPSGGVPATAGWLKEQAKAWTPTVDRLQRSFVLKQARPQLRTHDPWFCSVERIWREVEVLRICSRLLESPTPPAVGRCGAEAVGLADDTQSVPATMTARTPRILFEDRENYAFAMTAAPRDHQVWKQQLLAGQIEEEIAHQCGRLLGTLHARSWGDPEIASTLADRKMFDDLRLDPYYRTVARNEHHGDAATHLERLIRSVLDHPRSLVHADFSPKNLLVYEGGLMMVDFETGHYGDPAFDLGFFLSHLALKALCKAPDHERYLALIGQFRRSYRELVEPEIGESEYRALVARGIQNFAGCSWARIDGKSKVDYLHDQLRQESVRQWCQWIFTEQPTEWNEVASLLEAHMSGFDNASHA